MRSLRRLIAASLAVLTTFAALGALLVDPATASSNTNACLSNATATWSDVGVTITGTASPDPVDAGSTLTLAGAEVQLNVPGDLFVAGYRLFLLNVGVNTIPSEGTVTIAASNTTEGTATETISASPSITIVDPTPANRSSGDESAGDLTVVLPLTDTTWTPTGGEVAFTEVSVDVLATINNVIPVVLECQPGTSSTDGLTFTPATPVPFETVSVVGGSTTTTTSTTSTTAAPTTTTSTTAAPTTTTAAPTTTTVPGATSVSGSATYAATCTNTVTPDVSELSFTVSGTAPSSVEAGGTVTLTDLEWTVSVPGSVLDTGIRLGLLQEGQLVQAVVSPSMFATNTVEGVRTPDPVSVEVGPIEVSDGAAEPASASFALSDLSWTATSDTVGYAMSFTDVEVSIGPLQVGFSCEPNDPAKFVVQTVVAGDSGVPPAAPPATPDEVAGISETNTTGGQSNGTLPRTGTSPFTKLLIALVMVDIGYMAVSATKPPRRRLA